MNLRLLAHIFNDLDLAGSDLAGYHFSETASFIKRFLEAAKNETISDLDTDQSIFQKESKKILPLIEYFLQINSILQAPSANLSRQSSKIIKQYEMHKRLLLPGGWRGLPGHALIYEFKQDEKTGFHYMLVWNTGSGISHHFKEETDRGVLYAPVKVYRFSLNENNQPHFTQFIEMLLRPQKEVLSGMDADTIYNWYIAKIRFFDGIEIDPTPYCKRKIFSQFSGTCSYRVFEPLLENYGFKKICFDIVHYEVNRFALEECLQNLHESEWETPAALHQLSLVRRHFSHTLRDMISKKLLSPARQETGFNLIVRLEKFLDTTHVDLPSLPHTATPKMPKMFLIKRGYHGIQDISDKEKPIYASFKIPYTEEFRSFEVLKSSLSDSVSQAINKDDLTNEIHFMESVFLNFPLDDAFWDKINPSRTELFEVLDLIYALQNKYYCAAQMQDGYSYAERVISTYSAAILAFQIACKLFKNNEKIIEGFKSKSAATHFFCIIDKPYFTILSSTIHKKMKQIDAHFSTFNASGPCFLNPIANEHAALVKEAKTIKSMRYQADKDKAILALIEDKSLDERYPDCVKNIYYAIKAQNIMRRADLLAIEKLNQYSKDHQDDWRRYVRIINPGTQAKYEPREEITYSRDRIDLKQSMLLDWTEIDHMRRDENQIQVMNRSENLSTQTCKQRQVLHLYSSKATQIIGTIEYIRSHLTEFSDALNELQIATALLFQSGLIDHEIRTNAKAISILIDSLLKGIIYYSKKQSNIKIHVEFLKMSVFLHAYLLSIDNPTPDVHEHVEKLNAISQWLQQSIEYISHMEEKDSASHFNALQTLQCLRLIHYAARVRGGSYEYDYDFCKFLIKDFSKINTAYIEPFISHHADRAADTLSLKTKIDRTAFKLNTLPERFQKDLHFQSFFKNKTVTGTYSPENPNIFLLDGEYQNHRVFELENLFRGGTLLYIEKKIYCNNQESWCELMSSKHVDEIFYLHVYTLVGKDKRVWISESNALYVEDIESGKIVYLTSGYYLYKLDDNQNKTHVLVNLSAIQSSYLKNFEHESFIEVWENLNNGCLEIHFPRYNLVFKERTSKSGVFYWTSDPKYHLSGHSKAPIQNFENYLALDNQTGFGKCFIIPKWNFTYDTSKCDHEYYSYIIDLEEIPKQVSRGEIKIAESQFNNSQRYAVYEQNDSDILHNSSVEDTIYLAYIYFIKREAAKAFELLSNIKHMKIDSSKSFEYLIMIHAGANNSIQGPDFISSKLLVHYVLAEQVFFSLTLEASLQKEVLKKLKPMKLGKELTSDLLVYVELKKHIPVALRLNATTISYLIRAAKELLQNNSVKGYFPISLEIASKSERIKRLETEYSMLVNDPAVDHNMMQRLFLKLDKKYTYTPAHSLLEEKTHAYKLDTNNFIDIKKSSKSCIDPVHEFLNASPDKIVKRLYPIFKATVYSSSRDLIQHYASVYFDQFVVALEKFEYAEKNKGHLNSLLFLVLIIENSELLKKHIDFDAFEHSAYSYSGKFVFNHCTYYNYSLTTACYTVLQYYNKLTLNRNTPCIVYAPFLRSYDVTTSLDLSEIAKPVCAMDIDARIPVKPHRKPASGSVDEKSEIFHLFEREEPAFKILVDDANENFHKACAMNTSVCEYENSIIEKVDTQQKRSNIKKQLTSSTKCLHGKKSILIDEIHSLVNAAFDPSSNDLYAKLAVFSETKQILNIDQTIKAYFKESRNVFLKKRKIASLEKVSALHEAIIEYLSLSTHIQKNHKIISKIEEMEAQSSTAMPDEKTIQYQILQLAKLYTQERVYDIRQYPEIAAFEYAADKLLFKPQMEIITQSLMKDDRGIYQSKMIQLIPGAGKSKVILPNIAKLRADGSNLVQVEVPLPLFNTNYNDLEATSKTSSSQQAHKFVFHRNMQCNSSTYRLLLKKLKKIIADRDYIITTRQSTDSLFLKYIETLSLGCHGNLEWERQVEALSRIHELLCSKKDVIIDEIHLVLDTLDELIYSLDSGVPLGKNILHALVQLIAVTQTVSIEVGPHQFINLFDVFSNQVPKPSRIVCQSLILSLAKNLVDHPHSPLRQVLELDESQKEGFVFYLLNPKAPIPDECNGLDEEAKNIVTLFKIQLSKLLMFCLEKNLNEHFGLPKSVDKSPLEREVSIPYAGNANPQELSRFELILVTLNFTAICQLSKPISQYLHTAYLTSFVKMIEIERIENIFKPTSHFYAMELYKKITSSHEISLEDVDLANEAMKKVLFEKDKNSFLIKLYCMENIIFPSILRNLTFLKSNSQNHTNHHRSLFGFAGSAQNRRTYDPSILYDIELSDCSDGKVMHYLLNKNDIMFYSFQSTLLSDMRDFLQGYKALNALRAFIDAGAYFVSIDNEIVARFFAQFYSGNLPSHEQDVSIKYILYFNQDSLLCALSTDPNNTAPILLQSTDNIHTRLGCSANECFTYYDQIHTTGIDITQAPFARALISIGNTPMFAAVQAIMRCRDIAGTHSCDFILLKEFRDKFPNIDFAATIDCTVFFSCLLQIQNSYLVNFVHPVAIEQMIENVFQKGAINHLRHAPTPMEKAKVFSAFKSFFFQENTTSFFQQEGFPTQEVSVGQWISNMTLNYMEAYKIAHKRLGITLNAFHLSSLQCDIERIKALAEQICRCIQNSRSTCFDRQVITQQQMTAQATKQTETQIEKCQPVALKKRTKWSLIMGETHLPVLTVLQFLFVLFKGSSGTFYSLNKIAQSYTSDWNFSDCLWLSNNFYCTAVGDASVFSVFKKPCYFLLGFVKSQEIHYVLITQYDAKHLRNLWRNDKEAQPLHSWIETPGGIPFEGHHPTDPILLKKREILLQQIHLFNANVSYLLNNFDTVNWVKDQLESKLFFLENSVLPFHPSNANCFPYLCAYSRKHVSPQSSSSNPVSSMNRQDGLIKKMWGMVVNMFSRKRKETDSQIPDPNPNKRPRIIEPSDLVEYIQAVSTFVPASARALSSGISYRSDRELLSEPHAQDAQQEKSRKRKYGE